MKTVDLERACDKFNSQNDVSISSFFMFLNKSVGSMFILWGKSMWLVQISALTSMLVTLHVSARRFGPRLSQ